jgi:hypothetical protein
VLPPGFEFLVVERGDLSKTGHLRTELHIILITAQMLRVFFGIIEEKTLLIMRKTAFHQSVYRSNSFRYDQPGCNFAS